MVRKILKKIINQNKFMNWKIGIGTGLAVVIVVIMVVNISSGRLQENKNNDKKDDILVYKRSEGWGPCPSKTSTCQLDTYLYKSGKLIFKGDSNLEIIITKDDEERIENEIRKSGVMDKDCAGPMIMDYAVEYEINISGKVKQIGRSDTRCWDDLSETNKIIDSYNKLNHQGGA